MTKTLSCLLFSLVAAMSHAQTPAPPPGSRSVVAIWPEGVPGTPANVAAEVEEEPNRLTNISVPTLTIYTPPAEARNGTAVIVCPGGGYRRLAIDKEGADIAAWLNGTGITVFVLKYRVPQFGHPAPLQDVLRAIRLVRRDAAKWGVDPAKIGVLGFSAGGHLAGSAATLYEDAAGRTGAQIDSVSARPDFQVLVYPVITLSGPYAHNGSRDYLLGKTPAPALVESLSLQNRVTAATPPAFLVHGGNDASVPVENSVMYYLALRKAGIAAELHAYQHGPHGVGILPGNGPISDWPRRCEEWLRARGLIK
jgi:acetyl esterase/lipase